MIKIDFHIHTIKTSSDAAFDVSLDKLKEYVLNKKLDAIAITNHNMFNETDYKAIVNLVNVPVFPGIEVDLERGHMLVISDPEYLVSFIDCCKKISDEYLRNGNVSINEFNDIFKDKSHLLLIPHYDKRPKIDKQILNSLGESIFCGEVSNSNKFVRLKKDLVNITPVLFSDIRPSESTVLPNSQTYLDIDSKSFSSIKECLKDKSKAYLNDQKKNNLFPILDDGTLASTGLNIIMGKRSTGKTYTMDLIYDLFGRDKIKYIRQFELIEKNKEEAQKAFDRNLSNEKSLFTETYLKEFKDIVDSMNNIKNDETIRECGEYIESLRNFAIEYDKLDSYAKVPIFQQQEFSLVGTVELNELIAAVQKILDNKEYQSLIEKYLERKSLINLYNDLIIKYRYKQLENKKFEITNDIIKSVKRVLQIKSSNNPITNFDCNKYVKQRLDVKKFNSLAKILEKEKEIKKEQIGKFYIQVLRKPISSVRTLQNIFKKQGAYKDAFDAYSEPFKYFEKLNNLQYIPKDEIYKGFSSIEYSILNSNGYPVSGGQRAEFNLEQKLNDACNYEMLLIDEPESSFDNIFLKTEINKKIKELSQKIPVFVSTHNNVVGASIKPDYILYTEMKVINEKTTFKIYGGTAGEKRLLSSNGEIINNYELTMDCLEGGENAYKERGESYETIKN